MKLARLTAPAALGSSPPDHREIDRIREQPPASAHSRKPIDGRRCLRASSTTSRALAINMPSSITTSPSMRSRTIPEKASRNSDGPAPNGHEHWLDAAGRLARADEVIQ